jgi:hypothetical protein
MAENLRVLKAIETCGFDRHKFDYSFRSDHHISFQMSLKYKHLNGSRSGRPTELAADGRLGYIAQK